jgi:hypothetical protein
VTSNVGKTLTITFG